MGQIVPVLVQRMDKWRAESLNIDPDELAAMPEWKQKELTRLWEQTQLEKEGRKHQRERLIKEARFQKGQKVQVQWNRRWFDARVIDVLIDENECIIKNEDLPWPASNYPLDSPNLRERPENTGWELRAYGFERY